MSQIKKLGTIRLLGLLSLLLLLALAVGVASAGMSHPGVYGGLVYIDANHNGVWDVGEEGYGGEYGVAKENGEWVWRYRGADVIFTGVGSGPEDPYITESLPYREMEDHEKNGDICSRQDMGVMEDDPHYVPVRPCEGTFGMISWADDVTWEVTIEVPEGYELTSEPVLRFFAGEEAPFCDFGIVPVAVQ